MADPFKNSHEHLLAELQWLDCLIGAELQRARRGRGEETGDALTSYFVSGREVERLLTDGPGGVGPETVAADEKAAPLRRAIDEREAASAAEGVLLTLPYTA